MSMKTFDLDTAQNRLSSSLDDAQRTGFTTYYQLLVG